MPYNPDIHHRRSIRLKGYDYSQAGMYFVTVCCQDRICRFGNIACGEMILNDAGKMVEKWCLELTNKFTDIELGAYVIMPNHFHAIIVNTGEHVGAHLRVRPDDEHVQSDLGEHVGAHLCVRPNGERPQSDSGEQMGLGEHVGAHLCVRPNGERLQSDSGEQMGLGEHAGSPLRAVIQWFKTMTTNEYIRGVKTLGWMPFNKKLWQRNYYEHIIRNQQSYHNISEYIVNNPTKWKDDTFYEE
jgi:REP element-mobilizing transposase RayT